MEFVLKELELRTRSILFIVEIKVESVSNGQEYGQHVSRLEWSKTRKVKARVIKP